MELENAKIWLENLSEAAKKPGGLVGLFHVLEQSEPEYRQAVEKNYFDAIQAALEIVDQSLSIQRPSEEMLELLEKRKEWLKKFNLLKPKFSIWEVSDNIYDGYQYALHELGSASEEAKKALDVYERYLRKNLLFRTSPPAEAPAGMD